MSGGEVPTGLIFCREQNVVVGKHQSVSSVVCTKCFTLLNLRLPAASAQPHSPPWDPTASLSACEREEKKKRESNTEMWRWEGEDEVPSPPHNWDLTLKRQRPPWSIFHRCLPAAGLSPAPPQTPSLSGIIDPVKRLLYWITQMLCLQTRLPFHYLLLSIIA